MRPNQKYSKTEEKRDRERTKRKRQKNGIREKKEITKQKSCHR